MYKEGRKVFLEKGDRFGRLTVIGNKEVYDLGSHKIRTYYLCRCDCGIEKKFRADFLKKQESCGCFRAEETRKRSLKHGHYVNDKSSREVSTYHGMKSRCYNPNDIKYSLYGGRGVKVCDRWLESFENFYEDMGPKPKDRSIDRIDTNGNYEPGNCKWSTIEEQNTNRRLPRKSIQMWPKVRGIRLLKKNNPTLTAVELARMYDISVNIVYNILQGRDYSNVI